MEDRKTPTPSQIETALTGYVTEVEAAKMLGFASRQAFHRRSEPYKRSFGRIKSPHGWLYSVEGVKRHLQAEGRQTLTADQTTAPFRT
jgi:hypothetical protein